MKEDLFRGEKEFTLDQAVSEANRCLLCYDPPCSKGCPAGTDPGRFIRKLRLRNITGAIRTIKQNNILGGSCAGLCPTHKLCEKECSATKLDRPIQIGKIQRFLIDYADKIGFEAFDKPKSQRDKVAVVGAGPAGLSCAATLAKEGIHVTLFEKRAKVGGVLRYGVPAYRLEESLLDRDLKDLEKLGVSLKTSSSISGKNGAEQLLSDGYKAVFLATGLVEPVRLIQNSAEGVFTWTDFLSKLKDGRSGEVIPYIKDKVVAVIGGGSVAIDCAESALKFGASDVYLLYRRSYVEMPAEEEEKDGALNKGIHFILLNQPKEYVVEGGRLKGVKIIRTKLGKPDASGRRSPFEIEGSEWELAVDAVIEAIGAKPSDDIASLYPDLKLNGQKLIVADEERCATSVKGIFAGGDVVRGPSLIVNAVKDGKAAAKAIEEYIRGNA